MDQARLEPGDVFLTRGTSLVSRLIRVATRTVGESRTQVNHAGLVVEGGALREAVVVEALSRVVRHRLWERYGPPRQDEVAVYRPLNLTPGERRRVVSAAEEQVGRRYGYLKAAAHFADWLLQGAYVFRRLTNLGRYPICSWLVACAFAEVGKDFGVQPGEATPDDIWDFIQEHPEIYEEVLPLAPLRVASGRSPEAAV